MPPSASDPWGYLGRPPPRLPSCPKERRPLWDSGLGFLGHQGCGAAVWRVVGRTSIYKSNNLSKIQNEELLMEWQGKAMIGLGLYRNMNLNLKKIQHTSAKYKGYDKSVWWRGPPILVNTAPSQLQKQKKKKYLNRKSQQCKKAGFSLSPVFAFQPFFFSSFYHFSSLFLLPSRGFIQVQQS